MSSFLCCVFNLLFLFWHFFIFCHFAGFFYLSFFISYWNSYYWISYLISFYWISYYCLFQTFSSTLKVSWAACPLGQSPTNLFVYFICICKDEISSLFYEISPPHTKYPHPTYFFVWNVRSVILKSSQNVRSVIWKISAFLFTKKWK